LCREYGITIYNTTPFVLRQLLSTKKPFPKAIKTITIGGHTTRLPDIQRLKLFYNNEIYLTYGLSEAGPRVFTNRLTEDKNLWNAMGMPLDNISVKLLCPQKQGNLAYGELLVSSPSNMLGYLSATNSINRKNFIGKWLRTHDYIAYHLETDNYYFINRMKDMIVHKGEKVFPGYIKRAFLQNPLVKHVKVYALQKEQYEHVLVADVQLNTVESSQDGKHIAKRKLLKWCKRNLNSADIPDVINIVDCIKFETIKGYLGTEIKTEQRI
jgi:long-chain acyl-CoA synthetase